MRHDLHCEGSCERLIWRSCGSTLACDAMVLGRQKKCNKNDDSSIHFAYDVIYFLI